MTQEFKGPIQDGQFAGRDINVITNHYYEYPKDVFNEGTSTLENMLEYCKYKVKQARKKQIRNIPTIIFFSLLICFLCITFFPFIFFILGTVSFSELSVYFPESRTLIIFVIVEMMLILWGTKKTKYLYPIINRNKKLIYNIELELEERKL